MGRRSFAFCFIVFILLLVSPTATILSRFKLEAVPPARCSDTEPMSTGPSSPRTPLVVSVDPTKPGEQEDSYDVLLIDEAYPDWRGQLIRATVHWHAPGGDVTNFKITRTSTGQVLKETVELVVESESTLEALMNFEDVEATVVVAYNGDAVESYSIVATVYDYFDMRDDLRDPNHDAGDTFDTALDLPTLEATGYMVGTGAICGAIADCYGTDLADYYYLFVEANENLTVKVKKISGGGAVWYHLYDEYLAPLDSFIGPSTATISLNSLSSQIVYIELLGNEICTYELEISTETAPTPPETYYPPMTLYGYYEGGNPTGEVMEDRYPVNCRDGQQFIARATYHGLPAPTLILYDQNETVINSMGITDWTTYIVYTTSYGEAITEFGISSSRIMTYEMSLYIVDRYDDFSDVDVGGTFDTATEVTLGAYGAGYQSGSSNYYPYSVPFAGFIESTYIPWGSDQDDLYKVNVTEGKEFRVTIASTEIEEICMAIYNEGKLPTYVDVWDYPVAEEGPLTLSWTPDKDQTAYVWIHTGLMGGIYYIQFGEGEYSHEFTYEEHVFDFLVISNSTISNFNFTQLLKLVTFDLIGMEDTIGFCNVTIPIEFLGGPYTVTIDDETLLEDYDAPTNGTHAFVYFTYNHSSHTVNITATTVIPEFPSFLILPLFTVATLLAVIVYRRKHSI